MSHDMIHHTFNVNTRHSIVPLNHSIVSDNCSNVSDNCSIVSDNCSGIFIYCSEWKYSNYYADYARSLYVYHGLCSYFVCFNFFSPCHVNFTLIMDVGYEVFYSYSYTCKVHSRWTLVNKWELCSMCHRALNNQINNVSNIEVETNGWWHKQEF